MKNLELTAIYNSRINSYVPYTLEGESFYNDTALFTFWETILNWGGYRIYD
jgi:NhaP-type Na+/H+ or K+/H+ antiporter